MALCPGVHQQEAAGAVGVLGHAFVKAGLAEQRGLLVTGDAADRDSRAQQFGHGLAVMRAGGQHLGHQRRGNVKQRQELRIPCIAVHVEQHGARGVGHVGRVQRAGRQLPQQPAVHRAEGQLAALRLFARAGHVVQQPADLGRGKIRVDHQPGARLDQRRVALFAQLRAHSLAPAVLPDDGVVHRLAGPAVPQHRGFALVGDAQRADVASLQPRLGQRLAGGGQLRAPDRHRVVLDPAGLRIDLRQFLLGLRHHLPLPIEDDAARAGRALVECEEIGHDGNVIGFTRPGPAGSCS